ncbi:hypothetical protein AUK11_03705 [bacterium CG2_30_37_16]|nr:MAG: hypothetical protein AUK11_03705 [bacterium CG2_30_37_16]PIP31128.1 MAG: hypothetical protein COX25_01025 [bacterium (Candidatus Howlettbacteria) CG23_combo_of_CG06-09_8_20_14_all_37_9]PIY00245.1 MAG: hypothetical protein COZ22_00705 [bacterium (Candidatus Howlettbacteria) CG_4_10_14_3_um_filter_37_10]PJB06059.1 MAG: hypothetical protein CO123_02865 [bacterium (Candidatus Howlettbacteria) CG_4_9_14_3_um_filter_37_10]
MRNINPLKNIFLGFGIVIILFTTFVFNFSMPSSSISGTKDQQVLGVQTSILDENKNNILWSGTVKVGGNLNSIIFPNDSYEYIYETIKIGNKISLKRLDNGNTVTSTVNSFYDLCQSKSACEDRLDISFDDAIKVVTQNRPATLMIEIYE